MKNVKLQGSAQDPISITRLAEYMVSFFTQITEFCIKELNVRLNPLKKEEKEANQNLPKIDEKFMESSQEQLSKDIPKKQEGYKKKRKRNMQKKPLFLLEKPKAPTSSYLLYLHSAKNDISAKYNITNVAQLTKLVSLEWKKLSEEQKEQYNIKSEIQKQRYKEQMQIYKKKYASEIRVYKKEKQMKYKNNWMENKKRRIEKDLNKDKSKNKNRLGATTQDDNQSDFSEEKQKQGQILDHLQSSLK